MKKKILAGILSAATVLTLTGLTGCKENEGEGPGASGNGGDSDVLTILSWDGNSDSANMLKLFLQEKGYSEDKVKIVGTGADGEGARDGHKQYLAGKGDADLIICDADWIATYMNDDSLTKPVSEIGLNRSDFTEAFDYTLDWGTNEKGEFMAPTFQATPGGFVYRADLAKQYLGVNSPEEMQEKVKDWDTFQATAAELYAASGNKTSLAATEGGLWQVFGANRTKAWVVGDKLEMDTAEQFYDIAKTMKDNKYLADVPQWEAPWYAAFKDGTALGDFVPTWGLTQSDTSILYNFTGGPDTDIAKNTAICEGPSGWFWGGSYICVAKKCNSPELAKEFLEFFCKNADSMKKYAEMTGDYVNNKTVMSDLAVSNPMLGGQNHFEVLTKVLNKLDLSNKVTKYDSVIKAAFNESVDAYLKGTKDKDGAIRQFKEAVVKAYSNIKVD